jgi:hypothetical protein
MPSFVSVDPQQIKDRTQAVIAHNRTAHAEKEFFGPDGVDPKVYLMGLEWSDVYPWELFNTMLVS